MQNLRRVRSKSVRMLRRCSKSLTGDFKSVGRCMHYKTQSSQNLCRKQWGTQSSQMCHCDKWNQTRDVSTTDKLKLHFKCAESQEMVTDGICLSSPPPCSSDLTSSSPNRYMRFSHSNCSSKSGITSQRYKGAQTCHGSPNYHGVQPYRQEQYSPRPHLSSGRVFFRMNFISGILRNPQTNYHSVYLTKSLHSSAVRRSAKTQPGLNINVALINLSEHAGHDSAELSELRKFNFRGKSLQDMMSLTEHDWEAMVDLTQLSSNEFAIYEAHKAAVAAGERFYQDPKTGYIVMTRMAHTKRGTCCGNACRHCPFGQVGVSPALRDKFKFNSAFFC